jgi:hypothetical protein
MCAPRSHKQKVLPYGAGLLLLDGFAERIGCPLCKGIQFHASESFSSGKFVTGESKQTVFQRTSGSFRLVFNPSHGDITPRRGHGVPVICKEQHHGITSIEKHQPYPSW